jgi:hypothetical protein
MSCVSHLEMTQFSFYDGAFDLLLEKNLSNISA